MPAARGSFRRLPGVPGRFPLGSCASLRYPERGMIEKFYMRRILLLMATVSLLSGCATVGPGYDPGRNWTQVCFPGSAIKRKVPNGAAYPDWMQRERGSCLHH